jgi:ATP-dependent DNA ligase
MKKCVWLRPERVAQVEFLEWTSRDRLRHARFVRTSKRDTVVKKRAGES